MSSLLRANIEEIVSLTDAEFEFALSHFTVKRFKKHQIVIQEGDYVKNDYYVVSGLMQSSYTNSKGKEHILQFAMQNLWITDLEAYHNRAKATLTVSCIEDSEILAITLENREKLCRELQKMEYFFRKKSTADYICLQKRILCLITGCAKDRYEHLVQQYPGLVQRVPKSLIASYLGVSRETLSRLV